MNKTCAIISGGTLSNFKGIEDASFVIACDKGYKYSIDNNIIPDLFVGDFDSYKGTVDSKTKVLKLPAIKDDTDTLYAIKYAINNDFDTINVYCALGGRLDHMLANIYSGMFASLNNVLISIYDDNSELYFLNNRSITLKKREGYSLSIFSLTDECKGVSIKNVKYSLDNALLKNSFPIGVSNEWISDAEISVKDGVLLVMLCKM